MVGAEPREFRFLSPRTRSDEYEISLEGNIEINFNSGMQPNQGTWPNHSVPSNVNLNEPSINIQKILDELEQLKEEKQKEKNYETDTDSSEDDRERRRQANKGGRNNSDIDGACSSWSKKSKKAKCEKRWRKWFSSAHRRVFGRSPQR